MKKSRIAEALEWMRDPMKVRGTATDRDVLKIQRKLEVDCHRAAKIVSRAELALRGHTSETQEQYRKDTKGKGGETERQRAEQAQQKKHQIRKNNGHGGKKIETDVQHTNVVLAPGNPDADTVSYYRN